MGKNQSDTPPTPKPVADWERIELDYRAGIKSLREIAEGSGVSHVAICKRAKRDGWERGVRDHRMPVKLVVDELDRAGFVYAVYLDDSANERFYKIGMSSSFSERFSAHQCASPFAICVACAYFVGNMREEERFLHAAFAEKRVRGEWFRLSEEDIEAMARRAKLT